MSKFEQYRRKQISEARAWELGDSLDGVTISQEQRQAGSPRLGDRIVRDPKNPTDQWLVSERYFEDNFEPVR